MASLDESQRTVQIAGRGHVYIADPDTATPDLGEYAFGDGTTLEQYGWFWLGDTSAENVVSFETDGGDTTTHDTWDRPNVDSTRESITTTVTINSVALTQTTVDLAFYGSTKDDVTGGFDINLGGTVEKSALIVIEDAAGVSGFQIRRASFGGTLPTLDRENFTEIPITGTILAPTSGKAQIHWIPKRPVTGKSAGVPSVTGTDPESPAVNQLVTVRGSNFAGVYAVTFGGRFASFTLTSGTEIRATVPSGVTGTVDLVVRNASGAGTHSVTIA